MKKIIICLIVAVGLVGCASTQKSSDQKFTKQILVTPGYGRVTFLRPSGLDLLSTDLTVDSVKVVTLSGDETASVEVKPGSYNICRNHAGESGNLCLKTNLEIVEGQSYYVVTDTSSLNSVSGWVFAALGHPNIVYSISLLEPTSAQDKIKNYRERPPLISKYPN